MWISCIHQGKCEIVKDPEFEALTMVNQMKLPYKRNEKTNEGRGCRLLN